MPGVTRRILTGECETKMTAVPGHAAAGRHAPTGAPGGVTHNKLEIRAITCANEREVAPYPVNTGALKSRLGPA